MNVGRWCDWCRFHPPLRRMIWLSILFCSTKKKKKKKTHCGRRGYNRSFRQFRARFVGLWTAESPKRLITRCTETLGAFFMLHDLSFVLHEVLGFGLDIRNSLFLLNLSFFMVACEFFYRKKYNKLPPNWYANFTSRKVNTSVDTFLYNKKRPRSPNRRGHQGITLASRLTFSVMQVFLQNEAVSKTEKYINNYKNNFYFTNT